jgi:hypothetical protein
MHCYSKLKKNEKWRLTCVLLSKGKDTIDLDAPLATSAWRPIGNKAAKAALANAASTEKTQVSITQCLAEVFSTLLFRDKKTDERWAALVKRQEENMELKKCKDDMSVLTGSTEEMSPRTRVAHNFFKGQILDDIEAKMAAAEAAATTPSPEQEPTPARASAIMFSSTPASAASASASASMTEQAHRAENDEVVMINGPTSTQDAPLASSNPFF